MQPFAGIFETYLLPNINEDIEVRLTQLMDAIKLVYASIYSDTARGYISAINYKIEEEKMAVIIQELVGEQYETPIIRTSAVSASRTIITRTATCSRKTVLQ